MANIGQYIFIYMLYIYIIIIYVTLSLLYPVYTFHFETNSFPVAMPSAASGPSHSMPLRGPLARSLLDCWPRQSLAFWWEQTADYLGCSWDYRHQYNHVFFTLKLGYYMVLYCFISPPKIELHPQDPFVARGMGLFQNGEYFQCYGMCHQVGRSMLETIRWNRSTGCGIQAATTKLVFYIVSYCFIADGDIRYLSRDITDWK